MNSLSDMVGMFSQAKNMVLESVGLSIEKDQEVEKWLENIIKLEGILLTLKKHFTQYAHSIIEMQRLSSVVSDDISSFFSNSEARKKYIKNYSDITLEISGVADKLFKEQFGWEVIALFDKWLDEIESLKNRIQTFSDQRVVVSGVESKLNSLRARKSAPVAEIHEVESQLQELQNNLQTSRLKMRESVKSLIDRRHNEMEAIFVRFMELQVDYFRINSGLVDGFGSSIDNYRKNNPRKGSKNYKASLQAQNNDTFSSLDTPPVSEPKSRDEYKKSPDSNKSIMQPDRKESSQTSNKPTSKAASPHISFSKAPSARNSVDEDILNFDQPKQAPKSQSKAQPEKPIVKDDDDDDFLGLGKVTKSPEVAGKKTAPNSNHSTRSSLNNINITITSPKNDDPFGFLLPSNNNNHSYSAPPSPLQNNYDAGLDDLFSAKPPAPKPTTINNKDMPAAYVARSVNVQDKIDQKVEDRRRIIREEEQRENDKFAMGDSIQEKVERWGMKNNGLKNLRQLLLTLNEVLWPNSGWENLSMNDLTDPQAVKKVYRKATILVHPDKTSQMSTEIQLLSKSVFDLLNKAWSAFQVQEKL